MQEEQAKILVEKEAADKQEALKVEEAIRKMVPPKEFCDVGTQTDDVIIRDEDDVTPIILYLREVPSA